MQYKHFRYRRERLTHKMIGEANEIEWEMKAKRHSIDDDRDID